MANDFCARNMTSIKINGIEYVLYNHVLETMAIFNVLSDCETNIMPEIIWNISPDNVNIVLHLVNNDVFAIDTGDKLSKYIEVIEFMRYLGVRDNILQEYIGVVMGGSVTKYIDRCKEIPYHDVMIFIFDNHFCWYLVRTHKNENMITKKFKNLIDKVLCAHFPINFQKKVIKDTILRNIPGRDDRLSVHDLAQPTIWSCQRFDCEQYISDIMDSVGKN